MQNIQKKIRLKAKQNSVTNKSHNLWLKNQCATNLIYYVKRQINTKHAATRRNTYGRKTHDE